jgi:hypothetical protein
VARRSPLNERYQKNTAPAGKTRRSAAAAKPKRDSGTASKAKPKAKRGSAFLGDPKTEEFRALRKLWWILLIGSLVITAGSLAVQELTPYSKVASVMLGVGYTLILYALFLDFFKIRKMRKAWQASGGSTDGSAKKSDNQPPANES